MVDYQAALKLSIKNTTRHKSLLFAYIAQFFANLALLFFVLVPTIPILMLMSNGLLHQASQNDLLIIIIIASIVLVLMLIMNAWFKAGIMGLLNAVVNKKEPDRKIFFATAKQLWLNFLSYEIFKFLLMTATGIPFSIVLYFYLHDQNSALLTPVIITLLLFLFCSMAISAILFFAIPAIVEKKVPALTAMKHSLQLFKKKRPHMLRSFFIYFGLMVFTIVISIAPFPLVQWMEIAGIDGSWRFLLTAAEFIITTMVTIAATLFMFEMYKS